MQTRDNETMHFKSKLKKEEEASRYSKISLAQQLFEMSCALQNYFTEISKTILTFKENIIRIEAENQEMSVIYSTKRSEKCKELETFTKDAHDYSYRVINPHDLFKAGYFQKEQKDHYSYHLINFFIQILQEQTSKEANIGLMNYQSFLDSCKNNFINLPCKYTIVYFVGGESELFNKNKSEDRNYHYLCLIDKTDFNIHLINPLNDYSIPNDVISLKQLLDQTFETTNCKIRIAHAPICKKFYNSGCHTLLNIYSLLSDIDKFINNFSHHGNDQMGFFIPDNEMIRQQSYTVLSYILQNTKKNSAMGAYELYDEYLKYLRI